MPNLDAALGMIRERSSTSNRSLPPVHQAMVYYDRSCINSVYRIPAIFPAKRAAGGSVTNPGKYLPQTDAVHSVLPNQAIHVMGMGATRGFSAFMTDTTPDLEFVSKGQSFPRYRYETDADTPAAPLRPAHRQPRQARPRRQGGSYRPAPRLRDLRAVAANRHRTERDRRRELLSDRRQDALGQNTWQRRETNRQPKRAACQQPMPY